MFKLNGKMINPSKLNTLKAARSLVSNSNLYLAIVHGDDNLFWVVSGSQSKLLVEAGYERV